MTAQVQVLTLLSKVQIDKGRYAVSFDVLQRKNTNRVKRERQCEVQVYEEHKSVVGGCSPEIELPLQNRKCDIQITVSGALKPATEWEQGEDIIQFNESLGEWRKILTFVPTCDEASGDCATIKFRVEGKVKHTVTIHDVPVGICSTGRIASPSSPGENPFSSQIIQRSNTSCSSGSGKEQSSIDEGTVIEGTEDEKDDSLSGTVYENVDSASGEGHSGGDEPQAQPDPPRPLNERIEGIGIRDRGPDVVPPEPDQVETAYDKILCNESLNTLSRALTLQEANNLIIGLGVSDSMRTHNEKNNPSDVGTAIYQSLRHWRSQRRSERQEHEASNQQLYEDLLSELDDVGRKDIKVWIKQSLEQDKKLVKRDFKHD